MNLNKVFAGMVSILSVTMLLVPPAIAQNDPPPAGGWVTGDWNVTDSRTYTGAYIYLYHGNLIIKNGGSLTLDGGYLMMVMDSNGQSYIEVQAGGTLTVKNSCMILSNSADYHYYFRVRQGGIVSLRGSTFRDMGNTWSGCPVENYGLYIASENVTIDSCTFTESIYGVYLDHVSPSVTNCKFSNIPYAGSGDPGVPSACLGGDGTSAKLNLDTFTDSYMGISVSASSPVVSRCGFVQNVYALYGHYKSNVKVDNGTFTDNYYFGVDFADHSNGDVRDCNFTNNGRWDWWWGGGAVYQDSCSGRFYRNTITNPVYGYGVYCSDSSPVIENCNITTYYRLGVYADFRSIVKVANSTIYAAGDAAVESNGYSSVEVNKCSLSTYWGYAAAATSYGTMRMANCTLHTDYTYAPALYLDHYACVTARDTTIDTLGGGVLSYSSNLDLQKVVITSKYYGMVLYQGTTASLDKCSINSDDLGIEVSGQNATANLVNGTAVSSRNSVGLYLVDGQVNLRGSSAYSQRSYSVYSVRSGVVNSVNSTITTNTGGTAIYMDTGGNNLCNFTNTVFDQGRVAFTEPTSRLDVFWFVSISVQWQSFAPAANATVKINNIIGTEVFDGTVNAKGELSWLPVKEFSRTQAGWNNYTSHDITAYKNGVKKMERRAIRSNTNVKILLSDPDPPIVNITYPPTGLLSNTSSIAVCGTAEDFVSGVAKVEYSIDSGPWAPVTGLERWNTTVKLEDGTHIIKVKAVDVGGSAREAAVSVLVDTVITLEVDHPAEGAWLNSTRFNLTGTAEPFCNVSAGGKGLMVEADGIFEIPLELGEGPQAVHITATDATGNTFTITRNITIDTTPPQLVLVSPANGSATSLPYMVFNGTVDPEARLTIGGEVQAVENGTFSVIVPLKEGNNTVVVRAEDRARNANVAVVQVRSDTIPPRLRVGTPADDALTARPELAVAGDTDGASVIVNGEKASLENGRFSATVHLVEGPNAIEVRALDEVGNANVTILHVTLDTRPPFLQVASPPAGFMTNQASLTVLGLTEPGANVTVNGLGAPNNNGTFTLSLRLLPGDNILPIRSVDAAGNVAIINRTVVLDQTPPALTITAPGNGFRTSEQKVTVRGTTDPGSTVTVNGVRAQIDDKGRFSCEISMNEGENSLVVTAVDQAGNPTTKIVGVVRTGPLSISNDEGPIMLLGILIGVAIGAVAGLFVGMRKRKHEALAAAPEEPVPGRYDVPDEPPAAAPTPPPRIPEAPTYPPYSRPAPAAPVGEEAPAYRPPARRAPPETVLPSVPEAETVPQAENIPTIPAAPQAEEDIVPWDEEPAPVRPRGKRGGGDQLDDNLQDIMKRLKS